MNKFCEVEEFILKEFKDITKENIGKYSFLKYPRFLHMMKMKVNKYKVPSFGSIMVMNTTMMGLMNLTTISFTPSSSINLPYLLIDTMSIGKKRLAYVEFYNTTFSKMQFKDLEDLEDKYKHIENYNEKEAWYVKERMKGSLIKCSSKKEEDKLLEMVKQAISCYAKKINDNTYDENNLKSLASFRFRMINEGNPSSGVLNKVLGKEEAITFFNEIIMPLK